MDGLLLNLGFEIRLVDYPMFKDHAPHTGADLRAKDGILSQSQIDALGLFNADRRQGHKAPDLISAGRSIRLKIKPDFACSTGDGYYPPRCMGIMTCRKLSSPAGRKTPGVVSIFVSRITLGVLTTSRTSRRKRTLKAMRSGPPSMLASITVWLTPVYSDCPEISTVPGWLSLPGVIWIRAICVPSRAKISACLHALGLAGVDITVRVWWERGMTCSWSGERGSMSWENRS